MPEIESSVHPDGGFGEGHTDSESIHNATDESPAEPSGNAAEGALPPPPSSSGEGTQLDRAKSMHMNQKLLDDWKCPITLSLLVDPVICEDGKSYEREAWVAYVAGRNRVPSPYTRDTISSKNYFPNIGLRNSIRSMVEHRGLELLPPAEYLDYHLKEGMRCMDKDQAAAEKAFKVVLDFPEDDAAAAAGSNNPSKRVACKWLMGCRVKDGNIAGAIESAMAMDPKKEWLRCATPDSPIGDSPDFEPFLVRIYSVLNAMQNAAHVTTEATQVLDAEVERDENSAAAQAEHTDERSAKVAAMLDKAKACEFDLDRCWGAITAAESYASTAGVVESNGCLSNVLKTEFGPHLGDATRAARDGLSQVVSQLLRARARLDDGGGGGGGGVAVDWPPNELTAGVLRHPLLHSTHKVLKQVHPNLGISLTASAVVVDMLSIFLRRIAALMEPSLRLSRDENLKLDGDDFDYRSVLHAIQTSFAGEVAKHAINEGTRHATKAMEKFSTPSFVTVEEEVMFLKSAEGGGKLRASVGLQFPVLEVGAALQSLLGGKRVTPDAGVFAAAVLEYLTAEVLELGGNAAIDNKCRNIHPRHIMLALMNDAELCEMTISLAVMDGGVLPNIQPALLERDLQEMQSDEADAQEHGLLITGASLDGKVNGAALFHYAGQRDMYYPKKDSYNDDDDDDDDELAAPQGGEMNTLMAACVINSPDADTSDDARVEVEWLKEHCKLHLSEASITRVAARAGVLALDNRSFQETREILAGWLRGCFQALHGRRALPERNAGLVEAADMASALADVAAKRSFHAVGRSTEPVGFGLVPFGRGGDGAWAEAAATDGARNPGLTPVGLMRGDDDDAIQFPRTYEYDSEFAEEHDDFLDTTALSWPQLDADCDELEVFHRVAEHLTRVRRDQMIKAAGKPLPPIDSWNEDEGIYLEAEEAAFAEYFMGMRGNGLDYRNFHLTAMAKNDIGCCGFGVSLDAMFGGRPGGDARSHREALVACYELMHLAHQALKFFQQDGDNEYGVIHFDIERRISLLRQNGIPISWGWDLPEGDRDGNVRRFPHALRDEIAAVWDQPSAALARIRNRVAQVKGLIEAITSSFSADASAKCLAKFAKRMAIRKIRHCQKASCLLLNHAEFAHTALRNSETQGKLSRDKKSKKANSGLKCSRAALMLLQHAAEAYLVDLLMDANFAALHAKRAVLKPQDLQFARRIRAERF